MFHFIDVMVKGLTCCIGLKIVLHFRCVSEVSEDAYFEKHLS